jgi:hypothetical protein
MTRLLVRGPGRLGPRIDPGWGRSVQARWKYSSPCRLRRLGSPSNLGGRGVRLAGCSGGSTRGVIRLAGFSYRVPIVLAGEPIEAVVADNLVQIYHPENLVASHAQRRKPDEEQRSPVQGRRTARSRPPGRA